MPGPAKDTSWHDGFLAALHEGATVEEAAHAAGVSASTVFKHKREIPIFRTRVETALNRPTVSDRWQGGRPRALDDVKKKAAIEAMARGLTLSGVAALLGVTKLPIIRARYLDPDFDAALLKAAGGRLRPLAPPECPGRHCGTAYGYGTMSCRKDPCRSNRVASLRKGPQ